MRAFVWGLFCILVTACGGGSSGGESGGGDAPEPETKALFSAWTVTESGARIDLDLTGKDFLDTAPLTVTFPASAGICRCSATMQKAGVSLTEGRFTFQGCVYEATGVENTAVANECVSSEGVGSFIHEPVLKTLQVCAYIQDSECLTFQ